MYYSGVVRALTDGKVIECRTTEELSDVVRIGIEAGLETDTTMRGMVEHPNMTWRFVYMSEKSMGFHGYTNAHKEFFCDMIEQAADLLSEEEIDMSSFYEMLEGTV